jgi:hypothetical protein
MPDGSPAGEGREAGSRVSATSRQGGEIVVDMLLARAACERTGFEEAVGTDRERKESEMNGSEELQPQHRVRNRWASWIAGIAVLAAIAALTGCASQEQQQVPARTLALEGEKATTHLVTISQKAGAATCSVSPPELGPVSPGDWVTFKNETGSTVAIFDFPTALFGTTSIMVPPGASVTLLVSPNAQSGATYYYSVSCASPQEARPRIVIRSISQGV